MRRREGKVLMGEAPGTHPALTGDPSGGRWTLRLMLARRGRFAERWVHTWAAVAVGEETKDSLHGAGCAAHVCWVSGQA